MLTGAPSALTRLAGENLRLQHHRWLGEELVRTREQRLRDRSIQMRLAPRLIGERVEDAEAARAELERVPAHRAGLRLRYRQRRPEQCLEVFGLPRSGLEHDEDCERFHPVSGRL